jgi:hypothetical protein
MKTATTLTVTVRLDAEEFMSAVLGSGWLGWSWWKAFGYLNGYSDDNLPTDPSEKFILVGVENPDRYDRDTFPTPASIKSAKLSMNDIAMAYGALVSLGWDVNHEDLDACGADNIMQYAVLGDIVYG